MNQQLSLTQTFFSSFNGCVVYIYFEYKEIDSSRLAISLVRGEELDVIIERETAIKSFNARPETQEIPAVDIDGYGGVLRIEGREEVLYFAFKSEENSFQVHLERSHVDLLQKAMRYWIDSESNY